MTDGPGMMITVPQGPGRGSLAGPRPPKATNKAQAWLGFPLAGRARASLGLRVQAGTGINCVPRS
jgi:hypothetical protein